MNKYIELAQSIGDFEMQLKIIEFYEMHKTIDDWYKLNIRGKLIEEAVGTKDYIIFHGYILTKLGRIYNAKLKEIGYNRPDGYRQATLVIDGHAKTRLIHTWIAEAFVPNPNGYAEVGHKDDNRSNNNVGNLEWVNRLMNEAQCVANGRKRKTHRAHFTSEELQFMWNMHKAGVKNVEIAVAFDCSPEQISRFMTGETYPEFNRD